MNETSVEMEGYILDIICFPNKVINVSRQLADYYHIEGGNDYTIELPLYSTYFDEVEYEEG